MACRRGLPLQPLPLLYSFQPPQIRMDDYYRYVPADPITHSWIPMGYRLIVLHSSVYEIPREDRRENYRSSPPLRVSHNWYRADETIILHAGGDYSARYLAEEGTMIFNAAGDYRPTPPNEGLPNISDRIQIRIHQASGEQEETDLCVVCQSEYESEETLGRLQCGHEYHADCITRWLLQSRFCPVCKRTAW